MSNGFLSQEEIDSLLKGTDTPGTTQSKVELLSEIEQDLIGEVGNISMGSAATALYKIINNQVNITTPVVSFTTLSEIKSTFNYPNILLDVEYTEGIVGRNILAMKTRDASLIANLMMGGDGTEISEELSEIEISAVQEAMNQMIGSAATSMSTMFSRAVNISPPKSKIWNEQGDKISDDIDENEPVVQVTFTMQIGDILESQIMQILPCDTAKKIISIMMGTEENISASAVKNEISNTYSNEQVYDVPKPQTEQYIEPKRIVEGPKVEVSPATFKPLEPRTSVEGHHNINLIMDVPLEVSVVLGRTKKSIREILSLGVGSLIPLETLAEEPVEILINGKKIALGEVVVVDENFGVRITSIVSDVDRIKTLK